MNGDCLTCAKLGTCTETSVEKVLNAFTCPIYTPVVQPVYEARWDMIKKYGDSAAVEAMVSRPPHTDEERKEEDEFAS